MRRPAMLLLPFICLQACGEAEPEAADASVEIGLERSVTDVRAAEAAASGPVIAADSPADLKDGKRPAQPSK